MTTDVLCCVFIVIGIVLVIISAVHDCNSLLACGLSISLTAFVIWLGREEIKPIDVYRGKTKLEITYIDSIPIDSVVVFKNSDAASCNTGGN